MSEHHEFGARRSRASVEKPQGRDARRVNAGEGAE